MKRVAIFYSIRNGGDGSAYLVWFLTEEQAKRDQELMSEGWGEPCYGRVETYEGSYVHSQAVDGVEDPW